MTSLSQFQHRLSSIWKPLLLFGILAIIPFGMVMDQYSSDEGFIPVIQFGKRWKGRQLAEVKALDVEVLSRFGYDGQFYAQLAVDPALRHPDMQDALDRPQYRARRIGLPLMAYVLGAGQTWWILQSYALVNLMFWTLLFLLLWKTVGFHRVRDICLTIALLWTTGTLVSVSKALTDLPAVVVSLAAISLPISSLWCLLILGFAGLIKETSLLSYPAAWDVFRKTGWWSVRGVACLLILVLPLALWLLYVQMALALGRPVGSGNFGWPILNIYDKLVLAIADIRASGNETLFFRIGQMLEIVSLFSMIIQAIYVVKRPRWADRYWQFGIGFAILFFVLGPSVLAGQYAFTRVLLPLTVAFNLLIHRYEGTRGYAWWFVLGNIGLGGLAFRFVLTMMGY